MKITEMTAEQIDREIDEIHERSYLETDSLGSKRYLFNGEDALRLNKLITARGGIDNIQPELINIGDKVTITRQSYMENTDATVINVFEHEDKILYVLELIESGIKGLAGYRVYERGDFEKNASQ